MLYFCRRVPTGGGKTWLAAKSVALVNRQLLRCEHSVILWLVPSKPIHEQTLRAPRDRHHPYHVALREAGWVTVMDLDEAKGVTRATLDTSTTANALLSREGFSLARANLQKSLIRDLIAARIRTLRRQAVGKAFQQALFADDVASRVAVSDGCVFDFHPPAYAPSRDDDSRFGHFEFRKHYYGRIGDFDSAEEFACACWLDTQAQKGRLQFWVRNLVRREGCSFFLQKADSRFYPDFVCRLPDATTLAVDYKGSDRWAAAKGDRLIGGLWAALSEGRCRFVMVREKCWDAIEALRP